MGSLGHVFPIVFSILTLSCIVTVSSLGEECFINYNNWYSEIQQPSPEDRNSVKLSDEIDSKIEAFKEELIDEIIIVQELLRREDLEIVATVAYMKILSAYFYRYSQKHAVTLHAEAQENESEEDEKLAKNLDLIASLLKFYANEPPYGIVFDRFQELYVDKEFDPKARDNKEFQVNRRRERYWKRIFEPSDAAQSNYYTDMHVGINFFASQINLRIATPSSEDEEYNIDANERKVKLINYITKFHLLDFPSFTYSGKKRSRINAIIQVFMAINGYDDFAEENRLLKLKCMEDVPSSG